MSDISGKLSENKDLSATISPKGGTLSASLMSGRGVGHGIPEGGTTGQALVKASNDDYDAIWKSLDSGDVAYSDSETYGDGTVGKEVSDLKSAISDMYPTDTASGAIASFPDGAKDVPVDSLKVGIEPVQDLHGYDNPWPAGGGKNKLPVTLTTRTVSGVTFTVNDDGTISLSGTATANINQTINTTTKLVSGESYKLAGCPTGGGTAYYMRSTRGCMFGSTGPNFSTATTATDEALYLFIFIASGTNTNGLVFKPMICLSTETDATYAPYSNICPISGHEEVSVVRCGKNLIDDALFRAYTSWSDTAIPYGGMLSNNLNRVYILPVKSGLTYTLSLGISATSFPTYLTLARANGVDTSEVVKRYTTDSLSVNSFTFTAEDGWIYYLRLGQTGMETSFNEQVAKIGFEQLELGSTATDYEPYQGETYTIELGDTIYRGELDVTKGELTVDRAMVGLEDLDWSDSTSTRYISKTVTGMVPVPSSTTLPNVIAEQYRVVRWSDGLANNHDGMAVSNDNNAQLYLYKDADTQSPTGKIVYELETPITISLTPQQVNTLYGTNNIWADTGDTDVTYKADVQLYIQKMIQNAINALS